MTSGSGTDPITLAMASIGITADLGSPAARTVLSFTGTGSAPGTLRAGLSRVSTLIEAIKQDASATAGLLRSTGGGSAPGLGQRLSPSHLMPTSLGVVDGVREVGSGLSDVGRGLLTTANGLMPNTADVMARNRLAYQSSLASPLSASANSARMNSLMGGFGGLNAFDVQQAGAVYGAYGYSGSTTMGARIMAQSQGLSLLTGMSLPAVAATLGLTLSDPTMVNRLRAVGVSALDADGMPVGPQALFDRLYTALGAPGWDAAKMAKNLQPGFNLSTNLEHLIPDPDLRTAVRTYFQARARNGGKPVDLTDADAVDPHGVLKAERQQRALAGSESRGLDAYGASVSRGATKGLDVATSMQEAANSKADMFVPMAELRGGVEAFSGTDQGRGGLAAGTTALRGIRGALNGATTTLETLTAGLTIPKAVGGVVGSRAAQAFITETAEPLAAKAAPSRTTPTLAKTTTTHPSVGITVSGARTFSGGYVDAQQEWPHMAPSHVPQTTPRDATDDVSLSLLLATGDPADTSSFSGAAVGATRSEGKQVREGDDSDSNPRPEPDVCRATKTVPDKPARQWPRVKPGNTWSIDSARLAELPRRQLRPVAKRVESDLVKGATNQQEPENRPSSRTPGSQPVPSTKQPQLRSIDVVLPDASIATASKFAGKLHAWMDGSASLESISAGW